MYNFLDVVLVPLLLTLLLTDFTYSFSIVDFEQLWVVMLSMSKQLNYFNFHNFHIRLVRKNIQKRDHIKSSILPALIIL